MNFLPRIFPAVSVFALAALCAVAPVNALMAEDVVVETNIQAISRQGVLPLRISCLDSPTLALMQRALGLHGAFDLNANARSSATLKVTKNADGLTAVCEGANKPFAGTLSVTGTSEGAVLELCDDVIVAVGKTYGWGLKPLFSKTKIAFSSTRTGNREIYTANALLRGVRQMTNHKSFSAMPHWHPSGKRIYYTTYKFSGAADVYSLDVDSGKPTRFAAFKNTNGGGAVSPDGKWVALALSARGPMDIYIAPANGGNPKILVKNPDVKTSPTWSPDGRTIVFAAGPTGSPRLYTVPASGGNAKALPIDLRCYAGEPDWSSASPTKIAFSYINSRIGRTSIAVYDVASKKTKDLGLLLQGKKISNPTWCADGRHIIAVQEVGKASFLVFIDAGAESNPKVNRISPEQFKDCYDPDALVAR